MTFPLTIIGLVLAWAAVLLRGWGLLLLWPAGAFLLTALAYRRGWHGAFGKRPDGRLAVGPLVVLLPYLLLTWAAWHFRRWLWQEKPYSEVADGLFLGRRVYGRELPDGIEMVVDLTAEFIEPRGVRQGRRYVCLPTLDATAPTFEAFAELVDTVAAFQGRVYVHCAVGFGRSATVIAAVLLRRGVCERIGQVIHRLQQARPGVTINRSQVRLLRRMFPDQQQPLPPEQQAAVRP